MIFMGIIEHGWNIGLPAFGLEGVCVTCGSYPMRIVAVFAMCTCASPEVGGFQGGHGKVELLFGGVRALCRNTPTVWCFPSVHERCGSRMPYAGMQGRLQPVNPSQVRVNTRVLRADRPSGRVEVH